MVVMIKVQENSGRKEYERREAKDVMNNNKKKKLCIFMLVITFQLADPCNMRMEDRGTATTEGAGGHHNSKSHRPA